MKRKTFKNMICPVARTLERVGEWWSILILRDAFHGLTRFDQFQMSLEIGPNILTRRLNALVDAGLLARRLYSEHPPRHEYILTDKGRDFWSVLVSLTAYGNKHFAAEGIASQLLDAETGKPVEPVLVDRASGRPLDQKRYKFGPGPGTDAAMRSRLRYADARRNLRDGQEEWDAYVKIAQETRRRRRSGRAKRRA
ncbi:MAG TPA: helix-turn-helix domain-containing protein [Rhizomicrobium sp.]|nr:helix-turn-helix domain-containing protein [Rhizomicrobium sp.]